jgi:hypothetical protein
MVLLLATTLLGILLSLVYGWLVEFIAAKSILLDDDQGNHFSITILLGMALLSGLSGVWSFFSGIGTSAVIFFCVLALLTLIGIRRYAFVRLQILYTQLKSLSALSFLVLFLFLLYAFFNASATPPIFDTGLYHAQFIRWIENYHVVAGLANLHARLGYNSTLFLLAAFLGFADLGGHSYQVPDLIILISLLVYCLSRIEQSRKALSVTGLVIVGIVVFLLIEPRVIPWLASPATDLPAALVCWMVLLQTMEKIEAGRIAKLDSPVVAIVILSLFDISLKLTTAPLLSISLYLLWKARATLFFKPAFILGLLCAVVLLPWIARNVVLTGYLIFPVYQIDVFRFDWNVPLETVKRIAAGNTSFARIPNEQPDLVQSMKFGQWFPIWYQALPSEDFLLINALTLGAILLTISAVIKKQAVQQIQTYGPVYAVCILGAAFWFVELPSPRFGYGFLIPLLWLLYAPILVSWVAWSKVSSKGLVLFAQLFLAIFILSTLVQFPISWWQKYLMSYRPYPTVQTNSVLLDGQAVFLPAAGQRCWYHPLPCTPNIAAGLAMRGPKIEDGFYISPK